MAVKPTDREDVDAGLMVRVRDGDEKAFRDLFQRYARRLVGYADRFFHNRARSEEVVQEVFLRVWRARARYEPRAKFSTWLYTITSRACLNELRRSSNRAVEPLDEQRPAAGVCGSAMADDLVEGGQMQHAIEDCLRQMPDNQRNALVLTRFGDHSYSEAAALLQVSVSAVKSLVFRAASAIRQVVTDRDGSQDP